MFDRFIYRVLIMLKIASVFVSAVLVVLLIVCALGYIYYSDCQQMMGI